MAINGFNTAGRLLLRVGIVLVISILLPVVLSFQANAQFFLPPFGGDPTPNLNLTFSFDNQNIIEGSQNKLPLNVQKQNILTYPQDLIGGIYAEIYKGTLNNSQLIFSVQTGSSGILNSQNTFSLEESILL